MFGVYFYRVATLQLIPNSLCFPCALAIFPVLLPFSLNNLQNKSQKFTDQDTGTTQPKGNFIHLNYKFIICFNSQNFPCAGGKFPV